MVHLQPTIKIRFANLENLFSYGETKTQDYHNSPLPPDKKRNMSRLSNIHNSPPKITLINKPNTLGPPQNSKEESYINIEEGKNSICPFPSLLLQDKKAI